MFDALTCKLHTKETGLAQPMFKIDLNDENRELFDSAYQAIVFSEPPAVDTWDDYLSLMKKFKAAGTEGEVANVNGNKVQLYTYREPCQLQLERGEMKILKERINKPIWVPSALERAVRLKKLLESAADENGAKV